MLVVDSSVWIDFFNNAEHPAVEMLQQLLDHGEVLEVGEIQIQPVTQRAGLGTVVLNDVIQRAKALGQTVRLSTGLKNDRALRWYLRLGFSITATSATHCYLEI